MELRWVPLTENACYQRGKPMRPTGIMVHSTGTPGATLDTFTRLWNTEYPGGRAVCTHAMLDDEAVYQFLPWTVEGWHSGRGDEGSANQMGYIGFEICEPKDWTTNKVYFDKAYHSAVELCVYLCRKYGLTEKNILCHSEGHQKGIASNHADVMHWFPKFGKDMDTFRADVRKELEEVTYEQWKEYMEQYRKELAAKPVSQWAQEDFAAAKEAGVTDGSRPGDFVTREEAAAMVRRGAGKQ
ncbi:MAG: N-acetylmuramoyl-L-alanine amidase family protein [Eubacteriales bacterium]|jgi:N-acetylmuramoyl-L-alanine amidase